MISQEKRKFQNYLNLLYRCLERKMIFIIILEELCGTTIWCLAFVLCLLKVPYCWPTLKKTPPNPCHFSDFFFFLLIKVTSVWSLLRTGSLRTWWFPFRNSHCADWSQAWRHLWWYIRNNFWHSRFLGHTSLFFLLFLCWRMGDTPWYVFMERSLELDASLSLN